MAPGGRWGHVQFADEFDSYFEALEEARIAVEEDLPSDAVWGAYISPHYVGYDGMHLVSNPLCG